jgi:hypothetical protein
MYIFEFLREQSFLSFHSFVSKFENSELHNLFLKLENKKKKKTLYQVRTKEVTQFTHF